MSPSENHLRAALRDGEGASIDPDLVVMRAQAYRSARRGRIASMTAAAVTVAVVGVGGGLLLTNGSDHRSSADKAASGGGNALGSGSEYAASAPKAGNDSRGSAAIAPGCPDSVPEVPLVSTPATPRTTLYSATLASARVCSYSDAAKAAQRSIALTGADAASLGTSMSATQPGAVPCPITTAAQGPTFVVIAVYASGDEPLPIITHWNTCGIVTNGPVTRSGWQPPVPVKAFIVSMASSTAKSGNSTVAPAPTS